MAARAHAMDKILPCKPDGKTLGTRQEPKTEASLGYDTTGDGLTFRTAAADAGASRSPGRSPRKLWLSSETKDADLFLALRVFDPAGKEVTFHRLGTIPDARRAGGCAPRTASSIRKSRDLSAVAYPRRSVTAHAGRAGGTDVEIWPTSIGVPPGHRLALTVRGKDYEVDGTDAALPNAPYPMKGVGPFLHIDPDDRPPATSLAATRCTLPPAAAIPLVADHSLGVSCLQKLKRREDTVMRRIATSHWPFLASSFSRHRCRATISKPHRHHHRALSGRRADRHDRARDSQCVGGQVESRTSSSRTSPAAARSSPPTRSRRQRRTATRCCCITCRFPRMSRSTRICHSIPKKTLCRSCWSIRTRSSWSAAARSSRTISPI